MWPYLSLFKGDVLIGNHVAQIEFFVHNNIVTRVAESVFFIFLKGTCVSCLGICNGCVFVFFHISINMGTSWLHIKYVTWSSIANKIAHFEYWTEKGASLKCQDIQL